MYLEYVSGGWTRRDSARPSSAQLDSTHLRTAVADLPNFQVCFTVDPGRTATPSTRDDGVAALSVASQTIARVHTGTTSTDIVLPVLGRVSSKKLPSPDFVEPTNTTLSGRHTQSRTHTRPLPHHPLITLDPAPPLIGLAHEPNMGPSPPTLNVPTPYLSHPRCPTLVHERPQTCFPDCVVPSQIEGNSHNKYQV